MELSSRRTERAIERATLVASTTIVPEAAVACNSSTWLFQPAALAICSSASPTDHRLARLVRVRVRVLGLGW